MTDPADCMVVPVVEFSVAKREAVEIDYTNWRGERSIRHIWPMQLFYGINKYHSGPQWFVMAVDLEKRAVRVFAMKLIHSWKSEHTG